MTSPTRFRSVAATIARVVALAAAAGVAFEVATRVDNTVRFGDDFFRPATSLDRLLVRDSLSMHGRSGARFQQFALNHEGMRGPEPRPVKQPDVLRVVVMGASETFGLYEKPGREYPRQLEDTLRISAACRARFRDVEVINAASVGISLPRQVQDLERRIAGLHPDVVLFYPTPVQYLSPVPNADDPWPPGLEPAAPVPLASAGLQRLASELRRAMPRYLKSFVWREQLRRLTAQQGPAALYASAPDSELSRFGSDLRQGLRAARDMGALPVVATHANAFLPNEPPNEDLLLSWQRFYPRATGRVLIEFDSLAAVMTERIAGEENAVVVPLRQAMYASAAPGDFADFSHFTDGGSSRVAHVVATTLERTACAAPEAR